MDSDVVLWLALVLCAIPWAWYCGYLRLGLFTSVWGAFWGK